MGWDTALNSQPLTLFGGGRATRSYCCVDDLIDGLRAVMAAPDWDGLPVNLGRPEETSLLKLAGKITELCDGILQICHLPVMADDPQRRCADITRARRLLNRELGIGPDEGLARYVAALRRERPGGCTDHAPMDQSLPNGQAGTGRHSGRSSCTTS